jgi:hypothetical protein
MQSRFFLCCPMCGRRMPKDWLAKVTAGALLAALRVDGDDA